MNADIYKELTKSKSLEDIVMLDLIIHTESCLERIATAIEKIAVEMPELINIMKSV